MEKSELRTSFEKMDADSAGFISQMAKQGEIIASRVQGVKFVLVILSDRGMVYDLEALRQKIMLSYPDAAVFFQTSIGKSIGLGAPSKVDLLIDFSAPRQRQKFLYPRRLRKMARFAVGRNAGFFRKRLYDRIFDEILHSRDIPSELLERERFVQKKILNLAGISVVQTGEIPPDRGKTIALELPALQRT